MQEKAKTLYRGFARKEECMEEWPRRVRVRLTNSKHGTKTCVYVVRALDSLPGTYVVGREQLYRAWKRLCGENSCCNREWGGMYGDDNPAFDPCLGDDTAIFYLKKQIDR